jgi:ribosomal protein L21E
MAKFREGDAVVVASREQSPQDVKSGLYYPHYAGLTGKILKLYGEEASVQVDRESLPADIRVRHEEGEKAMRQKWLDNLSEEARGRVADRERDFALNYAVLVSLADLSPFKGARGGGATAAPAPAPPSRRRRKSRTPRRSPGPPARSIPFRVKATSAGRRRGPIRRPRAAPKAR